MSTHPFKERINMTELRYRLCGSDKIPKDFEIERYITEVYSGWGLIPINNKRIGLVSLCVKKHTPNPKGKSSKHRIFVICSCGREIPAGRVTQHTHKE